MRSAILLLISLSVQPQAGLAAQGKPTPRVHPLFAVAPAERPAAFLRAYGAMLASLHAAGYPALPRMLEPGGLFDLAEAEGSQWDIYRRGMAQLRVYRERELRDVPGLEAELAAVIARLHTGTKPAAVDREETREGAKLRDIQLERRSDVRVDITDFERLSAHIVLGNNRQTLVYAQHTDDRAGPGNLNEESWTFAVLRTSDSKAQRFSPAWIAAGGPQDSKMLVSPAGPHFNYLSLDHKEFRRHSLDPRRRTRTTLAHLPAAARYARLSRDEAYLAVSYADRTVIDVVDLRRDPNDSSAWQSLATVGITGGFRFSSDCRHLLVRGQDGIETHDLDGRRKLGPAIPIDTDFRVLDFDAETGHLVGMDSMPTIAKQPGRIVGHDIATGSLAYQASLPPGYRQAAFSRGGRYVFAVPNRLLGPALLLDLRNGGRARITFPEITNWAEVAEVGFTEDGHTLSMKRNGDPKKREPALLAFDFDSIIRELD
jgi:hypothetical protein